MGARTHAHDETIETRQKKKTHKRILSLVSLKFKWNIRRDSVFGFSFGTETGCVKGYESKGSFNYHRPACVVVAQDESFQTMSLEVSAPPRSPKISDLGTRMQPPLSPRFLSFLSHNGRHCHARFILFLYPL